MTAVAKDLSNPVRFGDHKTLHEDDRKPAKQELRRQSGHFKPTPQTGPPMTLGGKKKPSLEVPDYVALDGNAHVRFVGDLKTPWTPNLMSLNGKEVTWRRHIGEQQPLSAGIPGLTFLRHYRADSKLHEGV